LRRGSRTARSKASQAVKEDASPADNLTNKQQVSDRERQFQAFNLSADATMDAQNMPPLPTPHSAPPSETSNVQVSRGFGGGTS
jgi:hypothetical protein